MHRYRLVMNGAVKSTSTDWKAHEKLTLVTGSGDMIWLAGSLRLHLHSWQCCSQDLIASQPRTIQQRWHVSARVLLTPQTWKPCVWSNLITKSVTWCFLDSSIGYLKSYGSTACWRWPPTQKIPWSMNGARADRESEDAGGFPSWSRATVDLKTSCCAVIIHTHIQRPSTVTCRIWASAWRQQYEMNCKTYVVRRNRCFHELNFPRSSRQLGLEMLVVHWVD